MNHKMKIYKERGSWYSACQDCRAIHRSLHWPAAIAMAKYHQDLRSSYDRDPHVEQCS